MVAKDFIKYCPSGYQVMNEGKVFEKSFQESCKKEGICCIRLVDSNKFGDHTQARFTPLNICDFICHDGQNLFLLELT